VAFGPLPLPSYWRGAEPKSGERSLILYLKPKLGPDLQKAEERIEGNSGVVLNDERLTCGGPR